MRKIHATLALVRKWTPRRRYPTERQIQQEWEKPVLDLERTLERICELLNGEWLLTSSPARPAFRGPGPHNPEDIALTQRIHAALALARDWFAWRPHLTQCQLQEKWEKRMRDLEQTLKRTLAEVSDPERSASCYIAENWEEWNEWKQQVPGWSEREWKRIGATTVREVRRAGWLERELRDVAYVLNTDAVSSRFGNQWHYTGVRLFQRRNAAAAERQRM